MEETEGKEMTNEQKIKRWESRLADARSALERQVQWVGVRFGAMAATRDAERKVHRIKHEIAKLKFQEHNAGNCDPEHCSDCYTYSIAPNEWLPRGANKADARLTR